MPKKTDQTAPRIGAIYARFSSHNQREESIEQQVAECKAFAAVSGIKIVGIYADSAKTGRTDRRPQFQKLQRDARKGGFNTVIAYKSNRIARNMLNAMIFENNMEDCGITVLYAKEEFGNNAAGRFALRTMMNVNQFYSENMAEDIKRSQKDNAEKCRANGPAPYGYKTGTDGKFAIDEKPAAIVREIYERVAAGETFAAIAKDLNHRGIQTQRGNSWGKSSFSAILHNERYTGVYLFDDTRIENGMPIIIEKELFDMAQRAMQSKEHSPKRKRADNGIYLLTGKLFCGKCHSGMTGMCGTGKSGKVHHYYICNEKRNGGTCDKKAVRRDYIEKEVADAVCRYILQPDTMEWIVSEVLDFQKNDPTQIQIAEMQTKCKENNQAISNILLAIDRGLLSDALAKHLQELEIEKKELDEKISVLQAKTEKAVTKEALYAYLNHFKKANTNNKGCQKELFDTFVKAVYLYDSHFTIRFEFQEDGSEDFAITPEETEECLEKGVRETSNLCHQWSIIRTSCSFTVLFSDTQQYTG